MGVRSGSWKRRAVASVVVLLAASGLSACGGGDGDGPTTRQVRVDYSSDEYGSFALFNFPAKVTVRQGDTLEFKQTWTGEPHTVTGGTAVTKLVSDGVMWFDFFDAYGALQETGEVPNPDDPGTATAGDLAKGVAGAKDPAARKQFTATYEALRSAGVGLPALDPSSTQPFSELVDVVEKASDEFFSGLPSAFGDDDSLAQNVSQPCFLSTGQPPEDPKTPCADRDQQQPAFNGRQTYYSSGVIPYAGPRGNTFRMQVAPDAEPGTYLFYCAVHGPQQRTEVDIVRSGTAIPSQSEVNRQIRKETKEITSSLDEIHASAEKDGKVTLPGSDEPIEGPFAGLPGADHTAINAFLPRNLTVKAGEPITWKMMGSGHTISFNVPRYFPIMEFLEDGTVRLNPKLQPAAGGAVEYEPPDDEGGGGGGGSGSEGPPAHDGGTFDGKGFWSSGLIGSEPYLEYTMRISKPGTYAYACLLHPPMVGRIKVTA
jgi:plastocyanin